jgi:hypothetical protein
MSEFVSELKRREMWKKERKDLEDLISSLWEAKRIEKRLDNVSSK